MQNSENSAVATGLEKVSFHSNPKERQCQRLLRRHSELSEMATVNDNIFLFFLKSLRYLHIGSGFSTLFAPSWCPMLTGFLYGVYKI